MRITVLTILFLINTYTYAQTNNQQYKITGRIIDAATKQVIENATITLQKDSTKKVIARLITDKNGYFILPNNQTGTFILNIQYVGFKELNKPVTGNTNFLLKDISLTKIDNTLATVTVTNNKQLIENKIDKTIFNVEKDISSQGGVATDALKKIPGVTVDIDGNVELLGNPSVKFLINGKPSAMFGNSIADALQSIPNSQIQSIEVITSPSAKYDATGTGGIINIILKKSKIDGFTFNANAAIGTRLENGSLNASYKHNKIAINTFFSGNAQLTSSTPSGIDRITTNNLNRLIQNSITDVKREGYKAGLSIDIALSKSESIAASVGFDHFGTNNIGNTHQTSITYNPAGVIFSTINSLRNSTNQLNVTDFENSISYRKKFKKKDEEIEINYNGSFGKNNTYYNQLQFYPNISDAFAGSNSFNPGKENEINLEVNYSHPVSEEFSLETGGRLTFQSISSNADVYSLNASTGSFAKDQQQSYTSNYNRIIYAGYVQTGFELFKYLDIKAGIRYEYTTNKADYSNAHNVLIPDYSNVAPSLIIGHTFENKQNIKLAYSYRIERPEFRDLNPFYNLTDPHNITTGNPNLQAELGKKIEFGYNKSTASGANLNLIIFYELNSPDIKPYITYYPTFKIGDSIYTDVTLTTRANISAESRMGFNLSGSLPITKKITIRPSVQLFNRHLKNIYAIPVITNAVGFRINANIAYQINKTLATEAFGNFNLGMRWQGQQPNVYSYTMAIRKQFWNNKASVGLIAVNAFNHYIYQTSKQVTQDFISNNYRNVPYQSFGITFSYKFGKLKITKQKEQDNYLYTPPTEN
jgi:outer membrane receptor protein involved in Fe transport